MSNIISRLLNETHHKPDILDCIANLSNDEVFTPPNIVNKVLDALPEAVWSNPELKWLDPATKTGIFLRQVAYRLMIGLKDVYPDEEKRRQHIFQNMLYGIAITELTALMARRSLYTSKDASGDKSIAHFANIDGNIDYENRSHVYIHGSCKYCGNKESDAQLGGRDEVRERHAYKFIHLTAEEASKMKFDVIVGNPPYQLKDGGHGSSAAPIYQFFIQQAKKMQPRYMSFIIPSRWFSGGKGLDNFRSEMLNDKHIMKIYDYPNANDCFPGVSIEGGVMYFIWDAEYQGDCEINTIIGDDQLTTMNRSLNEYDTFVRYNDAISIIRKVTSQHEETLDKKISSRKPFGFATNFTEYDQINNTDKVKIYANKQIGYVRRERISKGVEYLDKYKVLLSKSDGAALSSLRVIGNPILAGPNSCCTETYIIISAFNNEREALNLIGYMRTKFFRFLVLQRKITQDQTAKIFKFVPDLPMDQAWTDNKLYERYDLTYSEQKFIDNLIQDLN
jgi:site-specific DNA-methyltransferase (adenine-specific)